MALVPCGHFGGAGHFAEHAVVGHADGEKSSGLGASAIAVAFKGGTEGMKKASELQRRQQQQQQQEVEGPAYFADLLRECSKSKDLVKGKRVHASVVRSGLAQDVLVGNRLIQMYLQCGSLEDARRVLDELLEHSGVNVVSWTSMIARYAQNGHIKYALHLFKQMQLEGITPDRITLVTVFEACARPQGLEEGKLIHAYTGCELDLVMGSALINMYGKCGSLKDACLLFDRMPLRNDVTWNSLMGAYAQHGYDEEALKLYWQMLQSGCVPSRPTFVTVLGACASLEALRDGKLIHANLSEGGYEPDVKVQSALVNMYGKCGSLEDAMKTFDKIPRHDLILWSSMIAAQAKCGNCKDAFRLFQKMQLEGNMPNIITFVSILNACDSPEALAYGKKIHGYIVEAGYESDVIVGNAIVNMYGKCGSLEDSWAMFHRMSPRSVVTCNGLIGACSLQGQSSEALRVLQYMFHEGIRLDNVTILNALGACSSSADFSHGELFHALFVEVGFELDNFVGNALVTMYGKCGNVDNAHYIFQHLLDQDVRTWNAMILAYVQNGREQSALLVFRYMMQNGYRPDEVTFAITANACHHAQALREIHSLVLENEVENMVVGNALVVMYGKCGLLEDAYQVFETLDQQNVTTWNVMIAACAQRGYLEEAFMLFREMQHEGVVPNKGTLLTMVNACSSPREAMLIHSYIRSSLYESDNLVRIALLNLYGRCGSIHEAWEIFREIESPPTASWNAVISAYAQNGRDNEALKLHWKMQQEGAVPDRGTFGAIIKAYTNLGSLTECSWIEAGLVDGGVHADVVLGNALISMYGKCGSLSKACEIFNKMPDRDVVSWNTMGVSEQMLNGKDSIQHFRQMLQEGLPPDKITFLTVLNACANLPALEEGKLVHICISQTRFLWNQAVANALVNMYAKCGSREEALRMFCEMHGRDVISWNVLIGAYGQHGGGKHAFELFQHMLLEGTSPDPVSFTSMLTVCSHGGLLKEGGQWFRSMSEDYGVAAATGHYGCIVDLLGRMGRLAEAEELADNMPLDSDTVIWTTLLGGCKVHGDMERGKRAAQQLMALHPGNTSSYVVLSTLFRDERSDG